VLEKSCSKAVQGKYFSKASEELTMPTNLENLKVIGDRVLIYPDSGQERTASGLYLPPTVTEKENVQSGYIVAVGPGTPIPNTDSEDDVWQKNEQGGVKYMPLEVQVGDYALYLKKYAVEIKFQDEQYIIVPMSGILVVERDDDQIDLNKIIGHIE
jgi:co-chaperonin GroES (HSP10)